MAKLIAALVAIGLLFGLNWLSDRSVAKDNITCVRQAGPAGAVKYELCTAGQAQPQVVPYSVWHTAHVGGYYDEGARTVYKSVDDDPHASHGFFGGDDGGDGEGHSVHVSGDG